LNLVFKKESTLEITKEMKKDGFSIEKIARYTGLGREEIENL
jgi:hypothetical protein